MSKVTAALTPGEWAQVITGTNGSWIISDREERGSYDNEHARAALALHGQPFGFTWEDVDVLEAAEEVLARNHDHAEVGGLFSLMSRIAALLPPRG